MDMEEMTMMTHPFDELFLEREISLHKTVFHDFLDNEKYDFFSIVDTYLQTSILKAKKDIGNLIAMNAASKGVHISIDYSLCKEKDASYIAPELQIVRWMAEVYCTVQWMYNIPSKEISKCLPAKELASIYDKYYSKLVRDTCKDIYREYLTEIKSFVQSKEK